MVNNKINILNVDINRGGLEMVLDEATRLLDNNEKFYVCAPNAYLIVKANEDKLHGTAFWEHENYGHTYIKSSDEEFNRMLIEDADDKSKWKLNSIVGYRDNRLLSYPCNYFHSKYPNEYEDQRIVVVMFYKYI